MIHFITKIVYLLAMTLIFGKCKQKMHVMGPLSRLLKGLADTKQTGPEEAVSVSIDE